MKYRKIAFGLFLVVFLLISASTLLWSGEPGDLVRNIVLKDISLIDGDGVTDGRQKFWKEISPFFDFEEMASRAMGRHWMERSPEEQMTFVKLFAKNIEGACMRQAGHRFGGEILSLREEEGNGYASVQVSLIKRTVEKVSVNFHLIRKDDEWRIYDVVLEGVSFDKNYRSQINSFLTKASFEDLVKMLKQRQGME